MGCKDLSSELGEKAKACTDRIDEGDVRVSIERLQVSDIYAKGRYDV